jgi:hypothetical protein
MEPTTNKIDPPIPTKHLNKIMIINKNNFQFTKLDSNNFNLVFEIHNPNIILPKIINFDLINLIYKLNPNVFEQIHTNKISETEININSLLIDLFGELGLPQYYSSLNVIKRECSESNIIFDCIANSDINIKVPQGYESVPLDKVIVNFGIVSHHKVYISCDIILLEDHGLPPFFEKITGNLIYNIFNKVKQFIENIAFNI